MSLKQVFQQITTLKGTPSENNKVELLRGYLQDPLFKKVTTYALDSRMTYNVKKFPPFVETTRSFANDKVFRFLDDLNKTPGSTKAQKQTLFTLASSDAETYEVVKRICNADLKCGCGVKLFNKAVKDSIFSIPYCRCSTDKKISNIVFPAYAQEKADGMFVNVIIDELGNIKFLSREGKPVKQLDKLRALLQSSLPESYFSTVFHGELLSFQAGKVLPRKVGNGIFSSCLYGLANQGLADTAILKIWDAIPLEDFVKEKCTTPYKERFEFALDAIGAVSNPAFQPVEYEVVYTLEEAKDFYARMRKLGREGAILKNFKAIWKYFTSPDQIKMKNVMDVEVDVLAWLFGKEDSKYAKCLGALQCATACRKLTVKVGSGYSDAQRGYKPVPEEHPYAILSNDNDTGWTDQETGQWFPPVYIDGKFLKEALERVESWVGGVAGVECESIIKSKTKETYSLYLPRFNEMRTDKRADTLGGLLKR